MTNSRNRREQIISYFLLSSISHSEVRAIWVGFSAGGGGEIKLTRHLDRARRQSNP